MCNNRCNGGCNRCEVVCDPCKKQPKMYYCGADITCVGVAKGEELSRVIKKIGDKVCQITNQENPLTYVNIEDATEEQCETGGFVVQILQVGSDNLVSEHVLCNGGDFTTTENILCGTDIVVEEGFGTQSALENITRYFCERTNTGEDISCDGDTVVTGGSNLQATAQSITDYFCERTSGFIPLSGTDVNNPVTGDIEMSKSIWIYILNGVGNFFLGNKTGEVPYLSLGTNGIRVIGNPLNPNHKGIDSNNSYFGANYDDNTYVQKKYVDTKLIPLDYGDIISVGGIENVQVYTTGTGTGVASVDLLPTIPIGKDITVSDLANNAASNNIQIDVGLGSTILVAGSPANQDIIIDSNGGSLTLRKMSATQFMVIAKTF